MICISISDPDIGRCMEQLQGVEMAEIRLDLTNFNEKEIKKVFKEHRKLIVTLRPVGRTDNYRMKRLKKAIECGAAYIDIEYEADVKYRKELMVFAREKQCEIIISYHNYRLTPSRNELERIVNDCYLFGADIVKIATQVNNQQDIANLLSLYSTAHRLVSIGMGEQGKLTRVLAPLMGAEFTYAAPDGGSHTAPGQLQKSIVEKVIEQLKKL